MDAYLEAKVREAPGSTAGRNLAREILQARILGSLQRSGAMMPLAFHGGTALRFLFDLPRFSEDLDFALERPSAGQYDFRRFMERIRRDLGRQGLETELRVSDQKTVHSAFVRFPGLLFHLGLSPHSTEILAIKIEVDTRPPAGAVVDTTTVRRHELLQLQHHDRASLFAGKLHAVLQRAYVKGRDLYDLLWYLTAREWPQPNLEMLAAALAQSGRAESPADLAAWRSLVAQRLADVPWDRVLADLRRFVAAPADLEMIRPATFVDLLMERPV